jgi:phage host-nuclease inhibitor protein Gam
MSIVDEQVDRLEGQLEAESFAQEFDDLPYPAPDNQITALTDVDVNRVLRRMAAEEAEIERIEAQANDEIERIRVRRDELIEAHGKRLEYLQIIYGPQIEEYTRTALEGAKKRSLDFIHGTAGFRNAPPSVEITDESLALAWAGEHCADAIKVTTSLLKTPIKAHIEATGEVVPGAVYSEGEDRFYLKVK